MKKLYEVVRTSNAYDDIEELCFTYNINKAIDRAIDEREYDERENKAARRYNPKNPQVYTTEIRELTVPDEFDLDLYLNGDYGDDGFSEMVDMLCTYADYNIIEF